MRVFAHACVFLPVLMRMGVHTHTSVDTYMHARANLLAHVATHVRTRVPGAYMYVHVYGHIQVHVLMLMMLYVLVNVVDFIYWRVRWP